MQDAPECPFCTNPATWTDRGWRCLPCGEPCAPDEDEDGDLDEGRSLGMAQAGLDAMARCNRLPDGGER